MATIYAVIKGSHDDYEVIGIYSTRERAQQYLDFLAAEDDGPDDLCIETYELDANSASLDKGEVFWLVRITTGGDVLAIERRAPTGGRMQLDSSIPAEMRGSRRLPAHFIFFLWAKSLEDAANIANASRIAWLASGQSSLPETPNIQGPRS